MNEFIDRNITSYIKIADVPNNVINKYKSIAPEELIYIWENMGLGIYENGFLQLVNPDEYQFVLEYIDPLLEPRFIWGFTALGDLLCWEGNIDATISPKEGNRCFRVDIHQCKRNVIDNMEGTLNVFIGLEFFLEDMFGAKNYLKNKNKLPKLNYGECYGYVPTLALGGSKSVKNLKVVNHKAYIELIGQAVGKIIDYGE